MKAEGSGTIDRRRSAARVLGPLAALVVSVALTGEPAGSSAGTSPSWLAQVTGDIRRMEYRFQPTEDGAWSAPSRAHDLRSRIDEGGLALTSRTRGEAAWKLGLCVRGFGRAGSVKEIEGAVLHADGDRIELRRYGLDEWYVNDEKGLEQGFTVYAPPGEGKPEAPLVIEMGLDGSMGAYPSADGREVLFKAADRPVLRYSELRVKDATGGDVPARLAFAPASLRIMIDDRDAVYPIEVDPVLSSPFWIAEGNQASAFFGFSVGTAGDVDGDGYSDVIVGAYGYDNGEPAEGVAFVYLGSASGPPTTPGWMAQSNQASSAFGTSVGTAGDVNGDGYDDVIVGATLWNNGNTNEGGAFVL